jgi:group I intron endonuclease
MVNYAVSKIYKLSNNVDSAIYIGSTCNALRKRKCEHKTKSVKFPDRQVYKHLNAVGWVNVEIILIESYPCINKDELHKRERYWIDLLKPELNKNIPTRTQKEWLEYFKQYSKQRREANPQCDKQYRENNKDNKKQYDIQYRNQKKDMRTCICGSTYNHNKLSARTRHYNTDIHIDFVAEFLTRFHL